MCLARPDESLRVDVPVLVKVRRPQPVEIMDCTRIRLHFLWGIRLSASVSRGRWPNLRRAGGRQRNGKTQAGQQLRWLLVPHLLHPLLKILLRTLRVNRGRVQRLVAKDLGQGNDVVV